MTAALVGPKTRWFSPPAGDQREFPRAAAGDPSGVTLDQLWDVVGIGAQVCSPCRRWWWRSGWQALSRWWWQSLGERRRECHPARAWRRTARCFFLVAAESVLLTLAGCVLGVALVQVLVFSMAAWLQANYGLAVSPGWPVGREWMLLGAVMLAGLLASLVPALRAYRQSLADGMMVGCERYEYQGIRRCGAVCRRAGGLMVRRCRRPARRGAGYKVGDRLARPAVPAPPASDDYREISWDDLMPADWDPMALLDKLDKLDMNSMEDADPRAMEALAAIRKAWDEARWCPP